MQIFYSYLYWFFTYIGQQILPPYLLKQVHLGKCAYKIVNKQMTDYLDKNLFED